MAVVRTRSVFVLILAAVGLLCLGCEPRVLVVGDSITALSKRKIIATWKGSGYDPSFLAIGEVGAVIIVSGALQGKTETATLYVLRAFDQRQDAQGYVVALSLALSSIVLLIAIELLKRRRIKEKG